MTLSAAYPVPDVDWSIPVKVDLTSPCPKTVAWKIVTTASRVVARGSVLVQGKATVAWDQEDLKGQRVSNGVYYFVAQETGLHALRAKILLLR